MVFTDENIAQAKESIEFADRLGYPISELYQRHNIIK